MLTKFDRAVIDYANSRGELSELVYARIDVWLVKNGKGTIGESWKLAALDAVKKMDEKNDYILETIDPEE